MSSTVQTTSSYLPSEYLSGGVSIAGLTGSGTNFTTMINQLRQIEMIPTQRMLRWKADWRERQNAFGVVRESLVNLRDICAKMNTMSKFMVKNATSSQPSIASAMADSSAIANNYRLEINKVATTSIWSLNNEFASGTSKVTTTDSGTFAYEYQGTVRNLAVPPNTSLEVLKNMINNDSGNPGVRASIIKSANGVTFQIKGMDQGKDNDLAILSSAGLEGGFVGAIYGTHELVYKTNIADATGGDVYANNASTEQVFSFTYNGTTLNVDIPARASLDTFTAAVNTAIADHQATLTDPTDFDLTVAYAQDPTGNYSLTFTGGNAGAIISAPKGGNFAGLGMPTTTSLDPESVDPTKPVWHIQHSENAQIKVDGWPSGTNNWLEVPSNSIGDVVEGLTFTLMGTGETNISVNTDTEAIMQNVVDFIDAVNNLRTTITELTKYDPNKATVDLNYSESLYDMQKGSILTGNYGIQMISSRLKIATASTPKGFIPQYKQGDLFLGDMISSLAQLGIKTKATGEGSQGFGLLELNTDPNFPILDDVLKNNPEAVAEFFAASNKGVSDTSDFSFVSSLDRVTRPGAFQVSYTLDSNGKVTGPAYINGKEAVYYEDTNQLGLRRADPTSSDASVVTASSAGEVDFTASVTVNQLAVTPSAQVNTALTSKDAAFATMSGRFLYTYNGQEYSVDVSAGDGTPENPADSLDMIAKKITYHVNNPGVTASAVKQSDGTYSLVISSKAGGSGNVFNDNGVSWTCADGSAGTSAYTPGLDAEYTISYQNPPGSTTQVKTVTDGKSNTVTVDGLPGVTFTLKDHTGTAVTVSGQKHNDADGLFIQIDNLSPGAHTGMVRIKQGKINEILELLNGTPSKPEEGMLGSKGTLQVLVDNYDKIVEGIDKKIERETNRLIKWERTQKMRFARLEATIKQYESLQASIESQVKQLGNNSK